MVVMPVMVMSVMVMVVMAMTAVVTPGAEAEAVERCIAVAVGRGVPVGREVSIGRRDVGETGDAEAAAIVPATMVMVVAVVMVTVAVVMVTVAVIVTLRLGRACQGQAQQRDGGTGDDGAHD
jgi:uncharacterized membrane protein